MYQETRVVDVLPINRLGYVEAYRCLRERNGFGVLASVRFALWLAYGNQELPPGELRSWLRRQYDAHPRAFGFVLTVWTWALIVFAWILATR